MKGKPHRALPMPQSMYIFKQAKIGSAVTPHQDSTFLHTAPKQTVLGEYSSRVDESLGLG